MAFPTLSEIIRHLSSTDLSPQGEIKEILLKRISSFNQKAIALKSEGGRIVLAEMQREFDKERPIALTDAIGQLKLQNMKIGDEFEKSLNAVYSMNPTKKTVELMFGDVSQLLIHEGKISEELVSTLLEEAKKFLGRIPPSQLLSLVERSIKSTQNILNRLKNGEKINSDLNEEKDRWDEVIPLMKKFWELLDNYKEIMGEDLEINSLANDILNLQINNNNI